MSRNHQREELRKAISKHLCADLEQCISRKDGKTLDHIVGQVTRSEAWRKFQKCYLLRMDLGGCCKDSVGRSGREDASWNTLLRRDSTSSIASILSESSLTGLSSDHIREVCNLLRSPSPSSKLHAVDILNSVAGYESLVACREWPVLEEWIRSLLRHPSAVIKRETLRLLRAMLSCGGVVFEHAYTSLLLAARDQVCARPSAAHNRPAPTNVVQLLNMYHKNLPRYWLRFPRRAVRHVIEQAFALMDDPVYGNFSRIWRSLAAVDGQAAWLAGWLRGAESRAVVFECLATHANVLLHALQLVTDYRKFPDLCQRNVGSHVYGACVLLRVLQHEGGRKLFGSLSSAHNSEKTWFDVFIKVVHFAKVLWASKYEPFSAFLALMTGTVSTIASLSENALLPGQLDSLVGGLAEWSKGGCGGQCSTHLLSECLGALCASSRGLALVTGSSHKGCRLPEVILTSTRRAMARHRERGGPLCTRCVRNFLGASSRVVGDPGHLLTSGCSAVVRLLSSASELGGAQEELRAGLAALVGALLSTCLGTALLCVGAIPESYEGLVLDSADLPDKLRYCAVRMPPDERREQVASCASSCVWGLKHQLRAGPERAREQLLHMMSPYRQGKILLARHATLWSALLQCPPDHPSLLPEESLLVALDVLQGLVCCLKTYLLLDCRYSLGQELHQLVAEFRDSEGRLIGSEVTVKVKEIQERIKSFSESSFPAPPHVFGTALGRGAANPIGLKHAGNRKEDFGGLLVGHKISAAGFWDLIDFEEEGDGDSVRPSVRSLTAEQRRGIQITVECGLNLGLLQPGHAGHTKNLEKLVHSGRHMYGSSCSRDSYDFLLATVFLLLRGNVSKSYQLHKFLCDRDCYALYFHDMDGVCDSLVCASLCQLFVVVLRDQLPRLYHAFRLCGYEPSNVLKHWVGQFFWGCLGFDEIAAVLLMVVAVGGEALLFVCLAMLKHVEGEALRAANQFRFIAALREARLLDFKLASYAHYITSLLQQYEQAAGKSLTMYAH